MGDSTTRAKVSVALVGVGLTWEHHYRDAVQRMSSKLSVRAVCDGVHGRATSVADELNATAVASLWCLTQRRDLHAWLILDPGWLGTYPASLAVRRGCSALLANTFSTPVPKVACVLKQSLEQGESLLPAFPQRFAPVTTRLRELMATKLGAVRHIEISIPLGKLPTARDFIRESDEFAINLIDWCRWLIGSPVAHVKLLHESAGEQVQFLFQPRSDYPATAAFRFVRDGMLLRRIECERGWANLDDPRQIRWQLTGELEVIETLAHERSPYEIILDQFCRRALGGLLPVPTARDALAAIEAWQQVLTATSR